MATTLTASAPATPQNLRVLAVHAESPRVAVLTIGWDASPGATVYEVGHVGPWGLWHRPIEDTTQTQATIGTKLPFLVQPGQPYTVYVRAGRKVGSETLWSVPAVLQVQVPQFHSPTLPSGLPPIHAQVQGILVGDSVQVGLEISAPGAEPQPPVQFFTVDTGAFETALTAQVASALHLPNLGAVQVGGVGGSAQAFNTQIAVRWPTGAVESPINAVVIQGFAQNLWGLRYAIDRHLTVVLTTTDPPVLTYYEGPIPATAG